MGRVNASESLRRRRDDDSPDGGDQDGEMARGLVGLPTHQEASGTLVHGRGTPDPGRRTGDTHPHRLSNERNEGTPMGSRTRE